MFKCFGCDTIFDEPKMKKEYRGEYWGAPAYEEMYYCPNCGSSNYDEYKEEEESEE